MAALLRERIPELTHSTVSHLIPADLTGKNLRAVIDAMTAGAGRPPTEAELSTFLGWMDRTQAAGIELKRVLTGEAAVKWQRDDWHFMRRSA